MDNIVKDNTPKKSVLLIDGQMPSTEGKAYFFYSENEKESDASPFGLARIGGYLDYFGVKNKIARLKDFMLAELLILAQEYDIIGISGLTNSAPEMYKFCVALKNAHPEKVIIGGREHFALDYEWILRNKNITGIDICCTGQGEIPLLALSHNIELAKIGSIAFIDGNGKIKKNKYFPRLKDSSNRAIGKPYPAKIFPKNWYVNIFPEFQKFFKYCGDTLVGSGCPYSCNFCANSKFLEARKYVPSLEIAKKEIIALSELGIELFFIRDLLLNADEEILEQFIEFMRGKNLKWIAFMSVRKYSKNLFKKMAEAGCVEIMVGIDDIEDRTNLKKGASNNLATSFIETAKKYFTVRCFLMLGLPHHYKYSRAEIKEKFLKFMTTYPQAIFRFGLWTPIIGTDDFHKYNKFLSCNVRNNINFLKNFDTMRCVIDPLKMYDGLNILKTRWAKSPKDWEELRDEIVGEYYKSNNFKNFLRTLTGLQKQATEEFQTIVLKRLG